MQPKKKSMFAPIIYGSFLILVLFLSLHGAIVYESVFKMVETGEIQQNQQMLTFLNLFLERTAMHPYAIYFNQYTKDWLLYGVFGWFIVIMAIESNKKNYIHGKEYGTAKWGTQADIRDLFASTLEAAEIKRAKGMRTILGRWKARYNLYSKCEKNGKMLLNAKMESLKEAEEIKRQQGNADKKLYREKQEEIKRNIKEEVALSKRQAWKPDQLRFDYEKRLKEIEESSVVSDEERQTQKENVKKDYEKKLKEFYDPSKRIAKIKAKYKDADMLFTKTERISFYNYILNQNTLILGGSGSGKTRGYVMPNILQAHSSYVITDPKGEILEKAGYFLSEIKGYKIRVLNLDEKSLSDGYNPFVYIHPDREGYEERVLSLIETIIINTDGGEKKGGSDPFWDKAERLFLQAIFFFVTDGFIAEERNMNTVFKLIQMLNIGEEEDNMDSDLDYFAKIFADRFGEDHIGVETFKEFRSKASGKTAKSIVISAVARLAPFRTSEIRRIFSYDGMHLDMVGEEKTAIFVVMPPTDDKFNFVAGMLFTQLFQELQYCATQVHKHDGQRLPIPCRFILDEFANTCTIPNFVKILAYARSFGIGITPILQSLEQIKNMYKDEWGVIVDNCNTLLYLGSITHMDTLEYMSKLLGKATFDKRTTGRSRGKGDSSSQNEDVVGRELMDTAEIRKLPKKDCLFIVGGRDPFYSEKYDYTSHPNYQFTSDANKEYSYHFKPAPPPEIKKQEAMEDTHGEDKKLNPSENANVKITPIEVDASTKGQLSRLTKNIGNMQPIPDEELMVNDGENTMEEINHIILAELVGEEEAKKEQAKLAVSQETEQFLLNLRANKIRMEENLIKTINRLGRCIREGKLDVIPEEEMKVNDGESDETIDEKMMEYILDEDIPSQEEMQDIEESLEDIDAMLLNLDLEEL